MCVKFLLLITVQKLFLKAIKLFQSYDPKRTATFLWFTLIQHHKFAFLTKLNTYVYRVHYLLLSKMKHFGL